ncbi:MAG: amidoligase family protein [Balneolaceae bacterium]
MKNNFIPPPNLSNSTGDERKIGVEFEFAGINLPEVADIIQKRYGGNIQTISTFAIEITDTRLGKFGIELDAQLIRDKKYEALLKKVGINLSKLKKKKEIEDILAEIASAIVPFEIVSPPVPFSKLPDLNLLVDDMRDKKAEGTGTSFLHAFGLHLNPEIPEIHVNTILNFLKSFIVLEDWIRKDADIDLSRRITPFIDDFDVAYKLLILNSEYTPDMSQFIDDYLKNNPTRNRPLDLLPLLEFIDKEKVQDIIDDDLTSARPAFHYRLPDCNIDQNEWSIAVEWNRWVLVEKLATDTDSLKKLSVEYLTMHKNELFGFKSKWIRKVHRWIYNVYREA